MITINPFSKLSEIISPVYIQFFVLLMVLFVIIGVVMDMIHKKNVKYFFLNAKKAKKSATRDLSFAEKSSVIVKTISTDVLTTSELNGKRRIAHLLGMYGTILFWCASVIMIFLYSDISLLTPSFLPALWHIGAIMTIIGGCWFWFFLRVDVAAEAYPWYRIIYADLFILSLVITSALGIFWSFFQYLNIRFAEILFLTLFFLSNCILFGGVYWSKFAHMFYKPGAAIQKNLAEADGSRDNLPAPSNAPKKYGLGIKREAPKHY